MTRIIQQLEQERTLSPQTGSLDDTNHLQHLQYEDVQELPVSGNPPNSYIAAVKPRCVSQVCSDTACYTAQDLSLAVGSQVDIRMLATPTKLMYYPHKIPHAN